MSDLKTLAVLLFASSSSAAISAPHGDLSRTFAECVGRFSAQMEHAWLMAEPTAETLEDRRSVFLSLLDATQAVESKKVYLQYRIAAKHAHARLLSHADFHTDARRQRLARRLAQAQISSCSQLLLDS